MNNKLIFVFLDGIGLGAPNEYNPLMKARMPYLYKVVGEPLVQGIEIYKSNFMVKGIDACLGVEGVPQSATGQAALFTGYNAPAVLGHHLPAYPNDRLIELINRRSLFKHAEERGIDSIFANSYTDGFFRAFDTKSDNYSVTTRCVLAGESRFNTIEDLMQGKAVHWDITNGTLQDTPGNRAPEISPWQAGKNLQEIAQRYDLVLYECFLPDLIGHRKDMVNALLFLETLDAFLEGLMQDLPSGVSVLITSDHGNVEDLSTGGHTKNPVPLVCSGSLALNFSKVKAIDEVFDTVFTNL